MLLIFIIYYLFSRLKQYSFTFKFDERKADRQRRLRGTSLKLTGASVNLLKFCFTRRQTHPNTLSRVYLLLFIFFLTLYPPLSCQKTGEEKNPATYDHRKSEGERERERDGSTK